MVLVVRKLTFGDVDMHIKKDPTLLVVKVSKRARGAVWWREGFYMTVATM
jgi:hypothetical protein